MMISCFVLRGRPLSVFAGLSPFGLEIHNILQRYCGPGVDEWFSLIRNICIVSLFETYLPYLPDGSDRPGLSVRIINSFSNDAGADDFSRPPAIYSMLMLAIFLVLQKTYICFRNIYICPSGPLGPTASNSASEL